jgi:hypothetical protein
LELELELIGIGIGASLGAYVNEIKIHHQELIPTISLHFVYLYSMSKCSM